MDKMDGFYVNNSNASRQTGPSRRSSSGAVVASSAVSPVLSEADMSGSDSDSGSPSPTIPTKVVGLMDQRLNSRLNAGTMDVEMEKTNEFVGTENNFDAFRAASATSQSQPAAKTTPTSQTATQTTSGTSKSRYTEQEKRQILEGATKGLTAEQIVKHYGLDRKPQHVASFLKRQEKKVQQGASLDSPMIAPPAVAAPQVIPIEDSNPSPLKRTSSLNQISSPQMSGSSSGTPKFGHITPLAPIQAAPQSIVSTPPTLNGKRKASTVLGEEPQKKQRKITDMGGRSVTDSSSTMHQELWEQISLKQAEINELKAMLESEHKQREKDEDLLAQIESYRNALKAEQDWRSRSQSEFTELLKSTARLERAEARALASQNSLRLGHIGYERTATEVFEHWVDGKEFLDIKNQKIAIEAEQKHIEAQKTELAKIGKTRRKSIPASSSSIAASSSVAGVAVNDEEESEDIATQAEIYKSRLGILKKLDLELEEKAARLEIEKALLIKELKRIADEDHSPWNTFPVLGDKKYERRYVLLHLVGKGGFSEVYKAYDLVELRFVACKIHQLASNWNQNKKASYFKHAQRETDIQRGLSHPRVVRLFEVFSIDTSTFATVMEFCKGGDLDTYLKQHRCLPEQEARAIITQIFQGLRYMNEQEKPVIHYDLKPGNIMFDEYGGVKITDFGLSKLVEAGDSSIELTSQGAGTYWYLPPECFDSPRDLGRQVKISSKVDVWSCGVIFYQMLYGKKPFGNNMSQAKILMENTIATSTLDFPAKSPKGVTVSTEAKEFIKRLLTRSPTARPDVFAACADSYLQTKKKGTMGPPSSRKKGPSSQPVSSMNLSPIAIGAGAPGSSYALQPQQHDPMDI